MLVRRVLRSHEAEHLDLVELVHAEDPACVLTAAPASRRKHVEILRSAAAAGRCRESRRGAAKRAAPRKADRSQVVDLGAPFNSSYCCCGITLPHRPTGPAQTKRPSEVVARSLPLLEASIARLDEAVWVATANITQFRELFKYPVQEYQRNKLSGKKF